jgi:hypothetical protein
LTINSDQGIEAFVKECSREFKGDLRTPKLFLGIQIERNKDKIVIHQRNYIRRLLELFNAPETPVASPLAPHHRRVQSFKPILVDSTSGIRQDVPANTLKLWSDLIKGVEAQNADDSADKTVDAIDHSNCTLPPSLRDPGRIQYFWGRGKG